MTELPSFNNLHVLVVGDAMLDRYWFGGVERISPEAPVPVIAVDESRERPGGAANVAMNVMSLGAGSTLLSVVGDDEAGRRLDDILTAAGVTHELSRDASLSTTIKLRIVARNQQLLRADFEQRPDHEVLVDCLRSFEEKVDGADVVVISDYGKGGAVHVTRMIELARSRDIPVLVDPKGTDYSKYRGATMLTPNLKEFEGVVGVATDDDDFCRRAGALRQELELDGLVVTRSEKGMDMFTRDGGRLSSTARALEVYDVSGAGDTVVATMAVGHAAGMALGDLLEFANVVAGIVVGKFGAAVATRDEIESVYAARDPS